MHADAGGSAGLAIQNIRDFNAMMQPLCQAVNNDGDASPHSNDHALSLIAPSQVPSQDLPHLV
jgi:hypothetical protein